MQEERTEERQDQPQDMDVGAGPPDKAEEQTGADSATEEETREDEQRSESEDTEGTEDSGDSGDSDKTDIEQEKEDAQKEVEALEGDPPQDLSDWPTGKAKYETFGGPEHQSSYDEAATSELGPSDVRHREDGTVEVSGEEVDNPDEFKNDPIPGGPTDPNTPAGAGEQDLSEKSSTVDTSDRDSSDDEDSDEDSGEGSDEDESEDR